MKTKSETEIMAIVQRALEITAPVTLDSSSETIPEWDSLGQINIIVALDEALEGGVSDLPDMATALSTQQLLAVLRTAGKIA